MRKLHPIDKLILLFSCLLLIMSWFLPTKVYPMSCENVEVNQQRIEEAIEVAGRAYGLDPCLLAAVIEAESSFRPEAVSPRGARGLMQLMPDTATLLGVKDSFNIEQNIMGGARYLADMVEMFGSIRKGLAAYNWGPGNLAKYGMERRPKETVDYIERVTLTFYGKAGQ